MSNQFEINQTAIDEAIETYKARVVVPYEKVQYTTLAECFMKFQKLVQEGRELYVEEHTPGFEQVPFHLLPSFDGAGGGSLYIQRLQSDIDAQIDAYRATIVAAEEQRLIAAKDAYVEAQVAAAVAEHEAEQARKAQAATDRIAEKARAAAIAALREAA